MTSTPTTRGTSTGATARTVSPWRGALLGAGAAVVLDVLVFFVANAALAGSVQVTQPDQAIGDLGLGAVVAAGIVPILLGAAGLWVLTRVTTSALRIWIWIAAGLTIASIGLPVTLPVDSGSKIALTAMHLLTGAAAIWGQRRAAAGA